MTELRCIHRHTIDEHPACFVDGEVNPKQAMQIFKETGKPWHLLEDYRIGYFDIESDGLKADFATMLSWCIKERDGDIYYDVVSKKDFSNGTYDQRIIKSAIDTMNKFKIICGYYSTKYDIPFLRSKALHYGIEFPEYGSVYHYDVYYTVKAKLCLSRSSLDAACDYLNIEGKTPLSRNVWRKAKYGDKDALLSVLEHNKYDVIILEELHKKLESSRKWMKRSV